jgi:apolipoprotein N-acyltransferase
VSFLVAMVNGAVVDLFCSPLFCRWRTGKAGLSRRFAAGGAACVLATAALLGYGQWRLSQSAGEDGPVIAVVQHAYPISLAYDDYASTPEIFDSFVASSAPLGGAGLDLLVWPETMLPTGLNPQVLQVDLASLRGPRLRALGRHLLGPAAEDPKYTDDDVRLMLEGKIHGGDESWRVDEPSLHQYAARLSELTVRLGCPLLGGGATVAPQDSPLYPDDYYVHRNSAMWFDGSPVARARYDKVKLVPFGEYVPFKYGWPALHRALRWFVPEVMDQLDPGREDTRFVLTRGGRTWRLVTPICYEGVFASRCRELVMDGGRKSADVMVNLSNDGWFIHQDSRRTCRPSTELDQHLAQYCFRAVECRVPVVRAVNTGVSASIDSGGAILSVVRQRVGGRWQRGMADGTLVLDGQKGRDGRYLQGHGPKVLVDRRVSLYSCWGDVFAWTVCLAGMPMVGVLYWRRGRAGGPEPAVIKGER